MVMMQLDDMVVCRVRMEGYPFFYGTLSSSNARQPRHPRTMFFRRIMVQHQRFVKSICARNATQAPRGKLVYTFQGHHSIQDRDTIVSLAQRGCNVRQKFVDIQCEEQVFIQVKKQWTRDFGGWIQKTRGYQGFMRNVIESHIAYLRQQTPYRPTNHLVYRYQNRVVRQGDTAYSLGIIDDACFVCTREN